MAVHFDMGFSMKTFMLSALAASHGKVCVHLINIDTIGCIHIHIHIQPCTMCHSN